MEVTDAAEILCEQEFVERFFNGIDGEHNLSSVDSSVFEDEDEDEVIVIPNNEKRRACEDEGINIPNKAKRRANLTAFGDNLTTKRKNESAKRELTSIVNQVL